MRNEKILAVVDCLHALAESLVALVEEEGKGEAAEQAEKKEPEGEAEQKEPEEKTVKLEDVRKVLAGRSAAGFTEQVRELLKKHGAARLSAVDPADYQAIINEAQELK